MSRIFCLPAAGCMLLCCVSLGASPGRAAETEQDAGFQVAWDAASAFREATTTRARLCINGLWQWQPAAPGDREIPRGGWGYFKVPGSWPGVTNYMQKDCQSVIAHASWRDVRMSTVNAAWHQRKITIPATWTDRRIAISLEYLNSLAMVYIDGQHVGQLRYPGGSLDVTKYCRAGQEQMLTMLVVAMPLRDVMASYGDSNAVRSVSGSVARRGLCGDAFLVATPAHARVTGVSVKTSVRRRELRVAAQFADLDPNRDYVLKAIVSERGKPVHRCSSKTFRAADVKNGRVEFGSAWRPKQLWDIHTPANQLTLRVALCGGDGAVVDAAFPIRFGFREFWINGRDFVLNGTRIYLASVPLDNAQIGAAWATYDAACESLRRLQSFGINMVYTHNYGCEPGTHLSFTEILRAADDTGMLVAFSQPHFGQYDWSSPEAEQANGYAATAAFYVKAAQHHPSVVMYSMSHNATGYSEDMNPDQIDGIHAVRSQWSQRNAERAVRAEAIVHSLDDSRIIYHHSSGNLGSMHTINFYPNWVPVQEMSDWFTHWSKNGVKPVFTCEYGAPFMWDWGMYRGWYQGHREFGSAVAPWDFCLAEWNAQFLGDRAYNISDEEKQNIRWEAKQFRRGELWHRWDYPHQLGARDFDERYPIIAEYLNQNWPAFRALGVSAVSPWEHAVFWKLRADVVRNQRTELATDWDHLQRPGFSPDFMQERYERMDLAYDVGDWRPTPAADALLRYNMPVVAYLANAAHHITGRDHNFLPGETVQKQIIVMNNSRRTITAQCRWSFALPRAITGNQQVTVKTGNQVRMPLRLALPSQLKPGAYPLTISARFSNGAVQTDRFVVDVLPQRRTDNSMRSATKPPRIGLFDPVGETGVLLRSMGYHYEPVSTTTDPRDFDVVIIGKKALTISGPMPDLSAVRDGLRVVMFEQEAGPLEKRLGFRVQTYGLRDVFRRVADHPVLAGLQDSQLRNWRGSATLVPPTLQYEMSEQYNGVPAVRWCGFEVPRLWRCGNYGSVASVVIEKPMIGDFLPLLDGGFSLQYSPLLEYREGKGIVLFCQMDVTGRTANDPAAEQLTRNVLNYALQPSTAQSAASSVVVAADERGLEFVTSLNLPAREIDDTPLTNNDVLVVGPDGVAEVGPHAAAIKRWLAAGGRLLTLGLDAAQANAVLPDAVATSRREHIATVFPCAAVSSALAGVGPADVHSRAPHAVPLVTAGAKPIGDGVLASSPSGRIVFCSLVPYRLVRRPLDAPAFAVGLEDPHDGNSAALVTMATVPWAEFGQDVAGLKSNMEYTLNCFVKTSDDEARVRLGVDTSGRGSRTIARSETVRLRPQEWTELRLTFRVDGPAAAGYRIFVRCETPEAHLRCDSMRLEVGAPVPAPDSAKSGEVKSRAVNLLKNAGFEAGRQPWKMRWSTEQQNLRRTFRRTAFTVNRLLANFGLRARTPLLERFSTPVDAGAKDSPQEGDATGKPPAPQRWLTGFYLDRLQPWDDPYRFFRW